MCVCVCVCVRALRAQWRRRKEDKKWRTFPIDHEKVKEFIDAAPAEAVLLPGGLPTVVLDRWIAGGELIEDDSAQESDEIDMTDE